MQNNGRSELWSFDVGRGRQVGEKEGFDSVVGFGQIREVVKFNLERVHLFHHGRKGFDYVLPQPSFKAYEKIGFLPLKIGKFEEVGEFYWAYSSANDLVYVYSDGIGVPHG